MSTHNQCLDKKKLGKYSLSSVSFVWHCFFTSDSQHFCSRKIRPHHVRNTLSHVPSKDSSTDKSIYDFIVQLKKKTTQILHYLGQVVQILLALRAFFVQCCSRALMKYTLMFFFCFFAETLSSCCKSCSHFNAKISESLQNQLMYM